MAGRATADPRHIIGEVNKFGDAVAHAATPEQLVVALQHGIQACAAVSQWSGGASTAAAIASLARTNRKSREAPAPEWALAAKAKRRAQTAHRAITRALEAPEKRTTSALRRIELLLQSVAATFYQIDAARLRELKRRTSFDYESIRA